MSRTPLEPDSPKTEITLPDVRPGQPRDPDTLRELLARIDTEGWNGPTGTALVAYIRQTIVRPLTVDLGLRGANSSEAEASAWEDVWLELTRPEIRAVDSPWGLLWNVARRSVLTEVMCARFPTSPSRAWKLARAASSGGPQPVESLQDTSRLELPNAGRNGARERPSTAVDAAVEALTRVGWPEDRAVAIVTDVLHDTPTSRSTRWTTRAHGWTSYGWRAMAERLDLPAWQARRLVVVLRGTADRPGLLPLLIRAGGSLRLDAPMLNALASTRNRERLSPVLPLSPERAVSNLREQAS